MGVFRDDIFFFFVSGCHIFALCDSEGHILEKMYCPLFFYSSSFISFTPTPFFSTSLYLQDFFCCYSTMTVEISSKNHMLALFHPVADFKFIVNSYYKNHCFQHPF